MTDRAFKYKLYFSDIVKMERKMARALYVMKQYDITIGGHVCNYSYTGARTSREAPDIEDKLYKLHRLEEKYERACVEYYRESRARYEAICELSSSRSRAVLIDRYLLNKPKEEVARDLSEEHEKCCSVSTIKRMINQAFEELADINPLSME